MVLGLSVVGGREEQMEESLVCQWSVFRSLLAILQWWGFNVTVIIMNKWIFQVGFRLFRFPNLPPPLSPMDLLNFVFLLFLGMV